MPSTPPLRVTGVCWGDRREDEGMASSGALGLLLGRSQAPCHLSQSLCLCRLLGWLHRLDTNCSIPLLACSLARGTAFFPGGLGCGQDQEQSLGLLLLCNLGGEPHSSSVLNSAPPSSHETITQLVCRWVQWQLWGGEGTGPQRGPAWSAVLTHLKVRHGFREAQDWGRES